MKHILLSLLAIIALSCSENSQKSASQASKNLNEVLNCKDLPGLKNKFGVENLIADTIIVMGDDSLSGTILYPKSNNQVLVFYHNDQIIDVTIMGEKSDWKTETGLELGMTLTEVEKINTKNFTISGFNWAHGGTVVSWEGGKLGGDKLSHVASFSNKNNQHVDISEEEYKQISGQTEFDVRHPLIQKLNPLLDQISIVTPYVPNQSEGKNMGHMIEKSQIEKRK
ncbi:hypothetical protein V7S76_07865 [Aquirufa sp. ROCK2-A2]